MLLCVPPSLTSCALAQEVPLAPLTTLGVGGAARQLAYLNHHQELGQLLLWGRQQGLTPLMLGGGSNVVIADTGLDHLVVCLQGKRIERHQQGEQLNLKIEAGYAWDDLARELAGEGFAQLACLVGIPGSVGGAPVQNIGAYGQELADVLAAVDVVDLATGASYTLPKNALGLGYRMSHFKKRWQGRYAITAVHLCLTRSAQVVVTHGELKAALERYAWPPHPSEIAQTVLGLRANKGMLYDPGAPDGRHAGSFFTNPMVSHELAAAVRLRLGAGPSWPQGALTKLSAAWLLEACGFARGWRDPAAGGRVGLSPRHALALTNFGGASAKDVVAVARALQTAVLEQSGVLLEAEPHFLGFERAILRQNA